MAARSRVARSSRLRSGTLRRLPARCTRNIWTSAGDGVHCYSPDGTLLGKINVPEVVANVCFGGPKRNRLFIAATTSLYAIFVQTQGALRP